jgi:hypothetical protein
LTVSFNASRWGEGGRAKAEGKKTRTDLERIVSISGDALVDGEQEEVKSIAVSIIESLHDMSQYSRVYNPRPENTQ